LAEETAKLHAAEVKLTACEGVIRFAEYILREAWDGGLDDFDVQEEAERLGLITLTRYDPAIHGEDDGSIPGDPWYTFSPAFQSLLPPPVSRRIVVSPEGVAVPEEQKTTPNPDGRTHQHLTAQVANGYLDLGIGLDTLRFAAEAHPDFWDGESGTDVPNIRITDMGVFAKDVVRAINDEAEDGSTLLTSMLDEAIKQAVEDGSEGADINRKEP
jgi:hypothetical protein